MVSPIQKIHGPRLFYPHFGFAYRATNTRIRVVLLEGLESPTKHVLLDETFDRVDTWRYFMKNLTEVAFLEEAWSADPPVEKEWRILLLFDINNDGKIKIDYIGTIIIE